MDNLFGSSGLQLLAQGNETPVSALASKQVSPVGFRVIVFRRSTAEHRRPATVPVIGACVSMYRSVGFVSTPEYGDTPDRGC